MGNLTALACHPEGITRALFCNSVQMAEPEPTSLAQFIAMIDLLPMEVKFLGGAALLLTVIALRVDERILNRRLKRNPREYIETVLHA